jgi:hypothetical protein
MLPKIAVAVICALICATYKAEAASVSIHPHTKLI